MGLWGNIRNVNPRKPPPHRVPEADERPEGSGVPAALSKVCPSDLSPCDKAPALNNSCITIDRNSTKG